MEYVWDRNARSAPHTTTTASFTHNKPGIINHVFNFNRRASSLMPTPINTLKMTSELISEQDYIGADSTSNVASLEAALQKLSAKRTNVNLRCVKLRVSLTQLTIAKYQARVSEQVELEENLARELVAGECEMKIHLMRLEALKKNVAAIEGFLGKAREKTARPVARKKREEKKTEDQKAVEDQKAEIQKKRELAGIAEARARYEFEDSYLPPPTQASRDL